VSLYITCWILHLRRVLFILFRIMYSFNIVTCQLVKVIIFRDAIWSQCAFVKNYQLTLVDCTCQSLSFTYSSKRMSLILIDHRWIVFDERVTCNKWTHLCSLHTCMLWGASMTGADLYQSECTSDIFSGSIDVWIYSVK
jgi:hypothetical protein